MVGILFQIQLLINDDRTQLEDTSSGAAPCLQNTHNRRLQILASLIEKFRSKSDSAQISSIISAEFSFPKDMHVPSV